MAYKCRICGLNDVLNQGDVCELCAAVQNPYTANTQGCVQNKSQYDIKQGDADEAGNGYVPKHGAYRKILLNGVDAVSNTDPCGNNMSHDSQDTSVHVFPDGQIPQTKTHTRQQKSGAAGSQPLSTGITKNITVGNQKRSTLTKWFQSLFSGIPFTLDNDITMFQVFPDFSGTALNAQGYACDQVIVYGRLNPGAVSENNDVEVFGRRDSHNNIIAKTIINKASGTSITPLRSLSTTTVWLITLVMLSLVVLAVVGLGVEGIIWTAVIILCLTNLPKVLKIVSLILGGIFSFIKRLF